MIDLVSRLNAASEAYYNGEAIMSDAEWDQLYDNLVQLEKEQGVVLPDSPTRKVGAEPVGGKIKHLSKMYSLDKTKTEEGLRKWVEKCMEAGATDFSVEYKYDGLSINLRYTNGVLTHAATRGNGSVGENVLPQIMQIDSIPRKIEYDGVFEVRGEVYMPLSVFEQHPEFKTARNAAAGCLRNSDVSMAKLLDVVFYDTDFYAFNLAERSIVFMEDGETCANIVQRIDAMRKKKVDFLYDGIVVKVVNKKTRDRMGYTAKAPRWAIAYKFEDGIKETRLLDVEWNVGKTGKVTPTAILEPVEFDGVTVTRATLNNFGDVTRKNLKLNGLVKIRRSNEVIPEILCAVEGDQSDSKPITCPIICPSCSERLIEDGANLFCTNFFCSSQIVARLVHFVSRDAMNIEGLSEKTLEALVSSGYVKHPSDLYALMLDDVLDLPGFGQKKAENLIAAIKKSRKCKMANFIYALAIPGVGKKTAQDIEEIYHDVGEFLDAVEYWNIDRLGAETAKNIKKWYMENTSLLTNLFEYVTIEESPSGGPLEGQTIVITGTLSKSRKDIEDMIKRAGGSVGSSVSKNTTMLLAGENAGSKLVKAEALGVRVISEEEFLPKCGIAHGMKNHQLG